MTTERDGQQRRLSGADAEIIVLAVAPRSVGAVAFEWRDLARERSAAWCRGRRRPIWRAGPVRRVPTGPAAGSVVARIHPGILAVPDTVWAYVASHRRRGTNADRLAQG